MKTIFINLFVCFTLLVSANTDGITQTQENLLNLGARLGARCMANSIHQSMQEVMHDKHPPEDRSLKLYNKCIKDEFKKMGVDYRVY